MRELRRALRFGSFVTLILPGVISAQTTDKPDLSKQPTLYAVGYAHLDTEWRWEYPQVIDEYLRNTMEKNFDLFQKYPHYIFNFSGANRYRLMKEYFPEDFAKLKKYVDEGRWFPAGSSMEEGDVNAPSAEAIFRQILYGNEWFHDEFGKASEEYMLPDCFGFPSSLPTILASSGVKGFSTQKLTWGSSAPGGGKGSIERTPEGTPFNVGVWVGPDGQSVVAALNPGAYNGGISTDLSKPLPPMPPPPVNADLQKRLHELETKLEDQQQKKQPFDQTMLKDYFALRGELQAFNRAQQERQDERYQGDWAARVLENGKRTGVFTDYHYYGTGDIGGSPREESVKRLEAIVTKGSVEMPPQDGFYFDEGTHEKWPEVKVGDGPVNVVSATADQMFKDITPAQEAELPRYTGEMELTNHSAGSLTSQGYQKRWIRKEELLADAAEKSSVAASWLGARPYPMQRLNDAWTLAMAAHFHDLAAGTATPKAYEFAWNDDVIAMNQFAGILNNATEAVAAGMNTEAKGVPVVVYNPLNIARQDIVQAEVHFAEGMPKAVRVVAPDGKEVPSQISNGKVLFLANVPSVGYATYDVQPATASATGSQLHVTENTLENAYYRVTLNSDGDVSSIFDKTLHKEMLSSPARLALSYDNPEEWPAWNMDWEQEQTAPKGYVSGPAKMRIVEDGPARIAIEVTRETAGSRFIQTVRLAAGDAGKRVEFGNVIDWATKERNLKAVFPLTASNLMATYNWGVGTIQRPTAEPKKFEVPSHQWIDLTDMSQTFGATILTDSKNGSDKPNDHTIRLTLIRTPGVSGGYPDEATQDLGHHEFVYGFAGHADDWRKAQTDWAGQELNTPLIAFETTKHTGSLGRDFSLLKLNTSRIQVMAVKKAEKSDETIVRLVELDGKPQADVKLSFAAPILSAREVNGQEEQIGAATVTAGSLVTSFGAYQPRTFALKLGAAPAKVAGIQSEPVQLTYDLPAATTDGQASTSGFDGKGDAYPAEMLPSKLSFDDVEFHLADSTNKTPNALIAKGQTIPLPAGHHNHIYLLAASSDGDQKAAFTVGGKSTELTIENWGGYIGQWDNRQWEPQDTAHDHYGEMVGLTPGFIKRANLAWYASHHHDAAGKNVPYSYSYIFAYSLDVPAGASSIKLPDNDKVRIFAISVADENPTLKPAQPLYDELPSANAGPSDFTLSGYAEKLSLPQGRTATSKLLVLPRGAFSGEVALKVAGLPEGVSATFSPASTAGSTSMKLTATAAVAPGQSNITVTGASGDVSHTFTIPLEITAVATGTVPVDLSKAYNLTGIYKDGVKYEAKNSLDQEGYSFSSDLLGSDQVGQGVVFKLGPAGAPDVITGGTVKLPEGKYSSLKLLATAVEGTQEKQTFTVHYSDGSSTPFTQSLSDWASAPKQTGESVAADMPYRIGNDGSQDGRHFYLNAYSFTLDSSKSVKSITLPDNRNVLVFGITLVPAGK